MTASGSKRIMLAALTYATIIAITLLVVDGVCMAFGLFPPRLDYGDPDLGWRPAAATGHMALGRCLDVSTGKTVDYQRNEDGVRTSRGRDELRADTASIKIGIIGDSQTDLCSTNAELPSGILESELRSEGIPVVALTYGAGKYSPLQDYLAFRKILKPYGPKVLLMNLYTGNDFYDILRIDDRPHFIPADSGYRIAAPVWYSLDDPTVHFRSRVLFAARSLAQKVGIRRLYLRATELRRVAVQQGAGLSTVLAYVRDLWKAREPTVGYPDAFTSQMLNQQLFFYHFAPSREESLRRIRALMALIRTENPGLLLVMSPLPSYELVARQPLDSALLRTLGRVPVTYEYGRRQEGELYEDLRALAAEQGWLFVDNLAALQGYRGSERLYNGFDYHLLPSASALVGRAQAAALADTLRQLAR
jgi:hypothetical protein